jgi:DNA-binding MarR family transcriptional regulator
MPRRPRLPGPEFGKPSETSDVCVCAAVRILSRAMTEPHVRALAGFGLSLTDFHLLVGLQSLSEVNAWHLAAMVRLDPAAVSRSLARLEERGDVERTSVRPRAPWRLTDLGRETTTLLAHIWDDIDARIRAALNPQFVEALLWTAHSLPLRRRIRGRGWTDD